jgi:hypothetical protein
VHFVILCDDKDKYLLREIGVNKVLNIEGNEIDGYLGSTGHNMIKILYFDKVSIIEKYSGKFK